MRVGQALSRVLDPSKPPMFGEDQEQLQSLLPEEMWEEGQAQQAQQRRGAASAADQGKPPAGGGSAAQRRREQREQRRREREQRRSARRHSRDGDPAEGPLTETDSDDAQDGWGSDASSLSSSGSEGSASSGALEAYDLGESDEEDPGQSKLQVGGGQADRQTLGALHMPGTRHKARGLAPHACSRVDSLARRGTPLHAPHPASPSLRLPAPPAAAARPTQDAAERGGAGLARPAARAAPRRVPHTRGARRAGAVRWWVALRTLWRAAALTLPGCRRSLGA